MTQAKPNTTPHPKVMQSNMSSTPRIDPAYDKVFAEKTVDSRYIRGDRELYQPPAMNRTYRRTSRPITTTNVTFGFESSDGAPSSDSSAIDEPAVTSRSMGAARIRNVRSQGSLDVPKLTFTGEYWRGFIGQFETYARNMPWTEANKIDAFSMCLRKEASEYFSILSAQVRSSFDEIKTKFEAHFEKTDVPSTIRWELLAVEQREDESLERFLTRLQKMIISAYPDTAQQELNCAMFIEAFLKGCRDKHSALAAGTKSPKTLEEAFKYVKQEQHMRRAIYGKKVSAKMVQQLHDSSDSSEESVAESAKVRQLTQARSTDVKPKVQFADQQSMENKIDRLEKTLSDLVRGLNRSPTRTQQPSISQMACYECGERGHFHVIAQGGGIHREVLDLMVPDIGIMMDSITEVIITDMMIQKDMAENHQDMVIVQIDLTAQGEVILVQAEIITLVEVTIPIGGQGQMSNRETIGQIHLDNLPVVVSEMSRVRHLVVTLINPR